MGSRRMSTACTDLHGHARTCTDSTDSTDVATERLVRLAVRLAAVMPRTRGYRVGADGSISVYPASPRVRLPAAKQEGSPMPPKCDSRSDQESKRAPILFCTCTSVVANLRSSRLSLRTGFAQIELSS